MGMVRGGRGGEKRESESESEEEERVASEKGGKRTLVRDETMLAWSNHCQCLAILTEHDQIKTFSLGR